MRHVTTEADRRSARLYGDTVPTLCGTTTNARELTAADDYCPECARLLAEAKLLNR